LTDDVVSTGGHSDPRSHHPQCDLAFQDDFHLR
jgi:hypothetical protein